MSSPALRIRQLRKTFGSFRAVDNLDLTVAPGTFHGIVGPNGAGKSTTIGMAVGLVVPDAGEISILGHDAIRDRASARAVTGVLPDGLDLPERLTGAELLRYSAGLRGLSSAAAAERAGELIEVLGITKAAATPLADCSTGNRKKVGLAQALLHAPRLLVLDEPFEAVDPVSAAGRPGRCAPRVSRATRRTPGGRGAPARGGPDGLSGSGAVARQTGRNRSCGKTRSTTQVVRRGSSSGWTPPGPYLPSVVDVPDRPPPGVLRVVVTPSRR
ncbi:ABC transporter ATP-binding protein [Actinoplanes philippinensis]|uniref:ABC transporter ATP-binding protein n=1 Tax=Actinoplanes philippinensis TaxID=35752 RepID=UPI0033EB10AC